MATEARVNWTVETPGDGKRAEKVSPIQRAEIKQAAVPWIDLPKAVLLPPGKDPAIAPHASEMVAIAITAGPILPGASEASEEPQKKTARPETCFSSPSLAMGEISLWIHGFPSALQNLESSSRPRAIQGMKRQTRKIPAPQTGNTTNGKTSPISRTSLRRKSLVSPAEKTAIAKLENRRRSIEITAREMIS